MFFFSLDVSGSQKWMDGWNDKLSMEQWDEFILGKTAAEEPLEFENVGGERLPDRLSAKFLTAVSPRMLSILESISATGYSTVPVILKHPPTGCIIEGYSGLIIHGRGGPLDEKKMKPVKKSGKAIIACNGFHIDEERWDGSDVFLIDGLGFQVWVTERVAEALQKARPALSNLRLTRNTARFPLGPEEAEQA